MQTHTAHEHISTYTSTYTSIVYTLHIRTVTMATRVCIHMLDTHTDYHRRDCGYATCYIVPCRYVRMECVCVYAQKRGRGGLVRMRTKYELPG